MEKKHQILGLDLLRFFAAFQVMLFHLGCISWARPSSTPAMMLNGAYAFPELAWAQCGWVGVPIFFMISGLVIAYSAENATAFQFVRSRILRLVPAVWICAPLSALCLIYIGWKFKHVLLNSLVFWPLGPWVDSVYWTLDVEIVFYLLVLLSIATGYFSRVYWIAIGLTVWNGVFVALTGVPGGEARLSELSLSLHGAFFGLGVFAWLAFIKKRPLAIVGIIAAIPVCLLDIHRNMQITRADIGWSPWAAYAVWIFGLAALIVSCAYNWNSPHRAAIRRIGLMTYPLYLLHCTCALCILRWLSTLHVNRWAALGTTISMVLFSSWAVVSIEKPVRGRLRAGVDAVRGYFIFRWGSVNQIEV